MAKGKVTPEIIEELKKIVGEKFVYTDKDKLDPYSHDEVTDPHYMKEAQVVVLPATTEEVSKVVKLCYDNDIVMVPRAAGTGLAAGAVAIFGGVIISIEIRSLKSTRTTWSVLRNRALRRQISRMQSKMKVFSTAAIPAAGTPVSSAVTLLPMPAVTAP